MSEVVFDLGPNPAAIVADPSELAKILAKASEISIQLNEAIGTLDDITDGSVQISFSPAEQTKLSGIEDNATADQTGAEIKVLYEGEADTNAFTDAFETKLTGVESGATQDQTDGEIETAYNNQVSVVAQVDAEAGVSTTVYRWTPERVGQAISALGSGGDETMAWIAL